LAFAQPNSCQQLLEAVLLFVVQLEEVTGTHWNTLTRPSSQEAARSVALMLKETLHTLVVVAIADTPLDEEVDGFVLGTGKLILELLVLLAWTVEVLLLDTVEEDGGGMIVETRAALPLIEGEEEAENDPPGRKICTKLIS